MSMIRGKVKVHETPDTSILQVGGVTCWTLRKGELINAKGELIQSQRLSKLIMSKSKEKNSTSSEESKKSPAK